MTRLFNWRFWVFVTYALAVGAIMIWVSQPDPTGWWPWAVAYWLYALLPVALLSFGRRKPMVRGTGALIIAAVGLWAFLDTMFLAQPDAQGALVLVVIPTYQLVGALVWLFLMWLAEKLHRKERE